MNQGYVDVCTASTSRKYSLPFWAFLGGTYKKDNIV
jgi:hypothetical protein